MDKSLHPWDEFTYLIPNFNNAAIDMWEWESNFTPQFTGHVITYRFNEVSMKFQ